MQVFTEENQSVFDLAGTRHPLFPELPQLVNSFIPWDRNDLALFTARARIARKGPEDWFRSRGMLEESGLRALRRLPPPRQVDDPMALRSSGLQQDAVPRDSTW